MKGVVFVWHVDFDTVFSQAKMQLSKINLQMTEFWHVANILVEKTVLRYFSLFLMPKK